MSSTHITLRPISRAVGAEVVGLNLRERLDGRTRDALRLAWRDHSLLVFRSQTLTWNEQLAFAAAFGQVPERQAGSNVATSTGELWLHFDHWLDGNYPSPTRLTTLYCMEAARAGGETIFADVRRAYNRLPQSLKRHIEGLTALHCYDFSSQWVGMRIRFSQLPPGQQTAVHPVARPHPTTGARVLYVSPRNTDRILELSEEDSESLIQELLQYIKAPDNMYSHSWSVGDVVVWDNNSVLHGRSAYDATYGRQQLRRVCVL